MCRSFRVEECVSAATVEGSEVQMKIVSDVALFLVIGTIPFVLAWARLNGKRAKAALYEAATYTPGVRR